MNKFLKGNYLILFFYFLVAIITFGKLPFTFFLQDEWAIFGNFIYWEKANLSWWERLFVYEQATHFIPLSVITSSVLYKLFGVSFFGYGVASIVMHIANSFLVFFLAKLFLPKHISFIAGLLFLVSSIPHQAITWTATTVGTAGSSFFVLLTLIFFAKYTLPERRKNKFLFLSSASMFISLLFKETSIFLFIFIPLFLILLRGRFTFVSFFKELSPFFLLGGVYLFLRLFVLLFVNTTIATPELITQPDFTTYIYRLFTIPLKFISQSIVPTDFILVAARTLLTIGYPHLNVGGAPNPYIVESVASDIFSFLLAFIVLLISFGLFYLFKKQKLETSGKFIFISVLFVGLSSLPFILIPGSAGYFSLVDGRHLYLTNIFASILLALLFYGIHKALGKKFFVGVFLIGLLFIYVLLHVTKIRAEINQQVGNGFIREKILKQISKKYPTLPPRVVFYVQSDKVYYGLPEDEKILPFQSGFGQVLLVWYNAHGGEFPGCMYKDQYLYVLLSEGYKECEGRGFGYFRDTESLRIAVLENKLNEDEMIAFSYTSSKQELKDITQTVRKQLSDE